MPQVAVQRARPVPAAAPPERWQGIWRERTAPHDYWSLTANSVMAQDNEDLVTLLVDGDNLAFHDGDLLYRGRL